MAEEFITLMADLDENSQTLLTNWYEELNQKGFKGTQTIGIPYHISLGSFLLDKEEEVIEMVKDLANDFNTIPVCINSINVFPNGRVLFAEPKSDCLDLYNLNKALTIETIDKYSWQPHITMLIDEPETKQKAFSILKESFHSFSGTITKLHLCAFWPTREILTVELKSGQSKK